MVVLELSFLFFAREGNKRQAVCCPVSSRPEKLWIKHSCGHTFGPLHPIPALLPRAACPSLCVVQGCFRGALHGPHLDQQLSALNAALQSFARCCQLDKQYNLKSFSLINGRVCYPDWNTFHFNASCQKEDGIDISAKVTRGKLWAFDFSPR